MPGVCLEAGGDAEGGLICCPSLSSFSQGRMDFMISLQAVFAQMLVSA